MSIEHKVQNETGRNPYQIGVNVLLLVAFFLLFHPLLSRGSLMYQPTISHWLTAGIFTSGISKYSYFICRRREEKRLSFIRP